MKKIISLTIMILSIAVLYGCTLSQSLEYDIITTLFPQYDIAKTLGQDDFNVYNVLPLGASPHDYEITSQDIQSISNATLLFYTSDAMEPWVSQLILKDTLVINLLERVEANVELHVEDEHDHEGEDPHYWTHPLALLEMVQVIKSEMIDIRADLADVIELRAQELTQDLIEEFDLLTLGLEALNLLEPTLYMAGHNALAYYADYFGLHIESMFPDFIPDAELTSSQLETFMATIVTNQVTQFFVEPYFDAQPLAADLIQKALEDDGYTVTYHQLYQFHNIGSYEQTHRNTLLSLLTYNRIQILESLVANHA